MLTPDQIPMCIGLCCIVGVVAYPIIKVTKEGKEARRRGWRKREEEEEAALRAISERFTGEKSIL